MDNPTVKLQAPLDPALVGVWRSHLSGNELAGLIPIKPRFMSEITLRADGTADLNLLAPERRHLGDEIEPPFPITWETSPEGRLTIYLPIAPMPEYEIMDWIQEAVRYDVLSITPDSMTLSNRPYDGESIEVFRRMS